MLLRAKPLAHCAGLLALMGIAAPGGLAQSVISPANLVGVGGPNSNLYPFSVSSMPNVHSMRYQQVYGAGDFAGVSGPITIRQIAFRPSQLGGNPFKLDAPDIQINLSTTSKSVDGLSANFSGNVGADDIVVYNRGPLPLSSAGADPLTGLYNFDVVITLATPFVYDPANGNLLLDVRNFGGSFATPLDAQNIPTDSVSRVYASDVTAASGTADSLGITTQFSAVIFHSVAGTVTLEGSANPAQPVILRLTNLDTSVTLPPINQTLMSATGSQGTFSLTGVPAGRYALNVKGQQWLAASQNVDLTTANVSGLALRLLAGDANNDNSVDSSDFTVLIGAYNSDATIPGSGYDSRADFNNDGSVDSSDFTLLINNFGQVGAN